MILEKYSMGIGDRFGRQGKAQLAAVIKAKEQGVPIAPVWNKSHREHTIVGTSPRDVRVEADRAVEQLGWDAPYYVDADHIALGNVEPFLDASNYFTIDVADFAGQQAGRDAVAAFVGRHKALAGRLKLPGIDRAVGISDRQIETAARTFLAAIRGAGEIYRRIERAKGRGNFVTEVSIDETDRPQSPAELLMILAGLADEGVPAQTIAPRLTGRFNKGVDYVGCVAEFADQFEQHLAVIALAVRELGLPENLKLSIHSGSDKFSIYAPMRRALETFDAGVHLKTAGTTWLEELIGLATAGGAGLEIAREIYAGAYARLGELCRPYAAVIDIDPRQLPLPDDVDGWSGPDYAAALRHDPQCPGYNPHFRQLLHVGYKVAAEMSNRYLDALGTYEDVIADNVTENIYQRHIRPLLLDSDG